ncbi:hypothetical protein SAMN06295905_1740 [Devosia lucknowensis]|uniref:Uncharacterized protein n=1 Tax=Devosia lucknowensis TaxID=1096929 RepID=A0A1Y6FC60_9HYPH|nr:hypothetical protein [Devosia lucknowensis]SMQ70033.1 hypothetical protein SAMN06295905_1740 [Devosia lucknowensis]
MPIDRRITNGLAWAGALLVVAIPAADMVMKQFSGSPQVAVVDPQVEADETEAVAPSLPTPSSQRPQAEDVAEAPAATPTPAPERSTQTPAKPQATDPVTTAATRPGAATGDAVDDFLTSGRPLPSYISGGSGTTPSATAATAPTRTPTTTPAPTTTQPAREAVAAVPPAQTAAPSVPSSATSPSAPSGTATTAPASRVVGFPTPVSQRPTQIARTTAPAPVVPAISPQQPPLIIDTQDPMTTAQDLEEWESGPLSEFLANRQGGAQARTPSDYDPNGFFLDQGPNPANRVQRFPRAYDDDYYYPFQ